MRPVRKAYSLPGGEISALHFGDMDKPASLVFLHATGFNGLAYQSLLGPIAEQNDVHIIALDLRGHGMTRLPDDPAILKNWNIVRDDVLAFFDRYIDGPIALAGHSFGAGVSLMAGAIGSDKIKSVIAFDPVTLPLFMRNFMKLSAGRNFAKTRFSLARNAGKRRALFESKDAVFARYHGRGPFKNTPDIVLRDYIDGGFKDAPGGVKLSCAPAWEQAVFVAQGQNIFRAAKTCLAKTGGRTQIIYAVKGAPSDRIMRARMQRLLGSEKVQTLKDRAHFFPLEDPEFTAGFLRRAIAD